MRSRRTKPNTGRLDQVVAEARRQRATREQGYRDQALRLLPWVCGRCGRSFEQQNLYELTVHHRDHDHDNNPLDGSNWELLCRYCHDNEHSRMVDNDGRGAGQADSGGGKATHRPFDSLKDLLDTPDKKTR